MLLFTVQSARYVLPLITFPYLARVLKPDSWGKVLLAQALTQWLVLILEYGFNLSTTREIARHRENYEKVEEIVSGVIGASGLLILGSAVFTVALAGFIPILSQNPDYLIWAWLAAVAQGISPLWYFQGTESLLIPTALDFAVRLVGTIGILCYVHQPSDAWKVIALQAVPALIASIWLLAQMYRKVRFKVPQVSDAWKMLRTGWSMFFFRSSASLYTAANTLILGFLVSPAAVACFAGVERLSKAALALLFYPMSQAVFPKVSNLLTQDLRLAVRTVAISAAIMQIFSFALAGVLIINAQLIVHIFLGDQYESATLLLKIFAIYIPCVSVTYALGLQWMLPLGLDNAFNKVVLASGLLNLVLIFLLTPWFGVVGTSWAVVVSTLFQSSGVYIVLSLKGLNLHQVYGRNSQT